MLSFMVVAVLQHGCDSDPPADHGAVRSSHQQRLHVSCVDTVGALSEVQVQQLASLVDGLTKPV